MQITFTFQWVTVYVMLLFTIGHFFILSSCHGCWENVVKPCEVCTHTYRTREQMVHHQQESNYRPPLRARLSWTKAPASFKGPRLSVCLKMYLFAECMTFIFTLTNFLATGSWNISFHSEKRLLCASFCPILTPWMSARVIFFCFWLTNYIEYKWIFMTAWLYM